MLVLTRHANEKIMIGDDIMITVVSVSEGRVRLAFDAPKEIVIHRREIWERVQKKIPWKKGE